MADSAFVARAKGRIIVAAVHVTGLLPFRLAQGIGAMIGWLNWRIRSRIARVTFTNLELCMPELSPEARSRLARASLMHTGRTLAETPTVWLEPAERTRGRIRRVTGEERLQELRARGKGVVLLLPHLGNWELINAYLGLGTGMTALYQPPTLPAVHAMLKGVRDRAGNELVPPTRQGLTRLYRALEEGRIVVVLPDQVPASGQFAPFFGVEALTDLLIPRLVRKTGAGALCTMVTRLPGSAGFEVIYQPAHPDLADPDPRTAATALNASIEACVRQFPEQFQWEYKRFKERPPGAPRLYH